MRVEVFYHICLQYGPSVSLAYVQQHKLDNLTTSDYYQNQFGSWLIQDTFYLQYTQVVKNLKARTWYRITSWAVDQYQNVSAPAVSEFFTQNNDGRLMRLQFHFQKAPNTTLKQQIACWLCTQYAYPCLNVVTSDALYCAHLTQYNLSFNSTRNDT